MASIAEIDEQFRPTQVRAKVILRADLAAEVQSLDDQLRESANLDGSVAGGFDLELAQRILDLREQVAASEVEFAFTALGRKAKTDLEAAHPPTKEQVDALDDDVTLLWNPETFPPALLAASCTSPSDTTAAWWARKYEEWPEGVIQRLWQACSVAHGAVAEVPKASAAFGAVNGSSKS